MMWSLVIPLVLLLPLASSYNYCHNKTHRCILEHKEHFMCRLGKFPVYGERTKFHAIVPSTRKFESIILEILNNLRNSLAGGELRTNANKTFAKAKRMRRLMWDRELAHMALSHASTLSFKHSDCRSTKRFPHVGECLAVVAPKDKLSITEICKRAIHLMFDEYKNVTAPRKLLKRFDPVRDYYVGHFTTIISDRVSRVGCGIAVASNCRQESFIKFCHFVTCHFDFNNVESSYVYKAGDPCSSCDDWGTHGSDRYPNLCMNTGVLFPPDQGDHGD
ncbi:scoloptoxin SSD976-like [Drosophila rhopaloa]|uniref:Venom allergen 3-like n=1 Tax=Drosophila rhopaloa TaxID=1041015 RepID=A0A6P4EE10_DRORH|nr:scoloptoxin SSD976-like [Drosophila rhopaloa]